MDNDSDSDTQQILARYSKITHKEISDGNVPFQHFSVHRLDHNIGYAGALNTAISLVETPFMAWLNDDAVPDPLWLSTLETTLSSHPEAAAVSSHLVNPDGATQSLGVYLTTDGHGRDMSAEMSDRAKSDTEPSETSEGTTAPFGFCGGAALLRTQALRSLGGVPATYFCYYEDTDTSWRLRLAGWNILTEPRARVLHDHGSSTILNSTPFHLWNERNRLLMLLRCAPASVALHQLARFIALTLVLPFRALLSRAKKLWRTEKSFPSGSQPGNFRFALRIRVLFEVFFRLVKTLGQRRRITAQSTLNRGELWRRWAGH